VRSRSPCATCSTFRSYTRERGPCIVSLCDLSCHSRATRPKCVVVSRVVRVHQVAHLQRVVLQMGRWLFTHLLNESFWLRKLTHPLTQPRVRPSSSSSCRRGRNPFESQSAEGQKAFTLESHSSYARVLTESFPTLILRGKPTPNSIFERGGSAIFGAVWTICKFVQHIDLFFSQLTGFVLRDRLHDSLERHLRGGVRLSSQISAAVVVDDETRKV